MGRFRLQIGSGPGCLSGPWSTHLVSHTMSVCFWSLCDDLVLEDDTPENKHIFAHLHTSSPPRIFTGLHTPSSFQSCRNANVRSFGVTHSQQLWGLRALVDPTPSQAALMSHSAGREHLTAGAGPKSSPQGSNQTLESLEVCCRLVPSSPAKIWTVIASQASIQSAHFCCSQIQTSLSSLNTLK